MDKNTWHRLSGVIGFGLILALALLPSWRAQAQAGTPDAMHQAINNLRAANGLAPLAVNPYLMQAAQYHANWIAAGNPGGHTGEGGNSSYDRAVAAGYGEGARVWVTENWARGHGLTAQDCVYVSWNDSAHMNNMLTTFHNEFGAGVALDASGMTVYVVDFGHVNSNAISQPAAAQVEPTSTPSGPTDTPPPLIQPVTVATPNPDGSVFHIVQFGQSLWTIADAYDIAFADLMSQNNLTEETPIQINQELIIVPASIQVEEIEQISPPPTLALTLRPSATPIQEQPSPVPFEPTPTVAEKTKTSFLANIFSGDTLWVGIGLVVVSVLGVALLLYTASRLK